MFTRQPFTGNTKEKAERGVPNQNQLYFTNSSMFRTFTVNDTFDK